MHIYTLIQVVCIGLLYGLKLSPAAMAYPLVIVLLIPLRWLLGKTLYTKEEIDAVSSVCSQYNCGFAFYNTVPYCDDTVPYCDDTLPFICLVG